MISCLILSTKALQKDWPRPMNKNKKENAAQTAFSLSDI